MQNVQLDVLKHPAKFHFILWYSRRYAQASGPPRWCFWRPMGGPQGQFLPQNFGLISWTIDDTSTIFGTSFKYLKTSQIQKESSHFTKKHKKLRRCECFYRTKGGLGDKEAVQTLQNYATCVIKVITLCKSMQNVYCQVLNQPANFKSVVMNSL